MLDQENFFLKTEFEESKNSNFQLNKRCGEIIASQIGEFLLKCDFCSQIHKTLNSFSTHFNDKHSDIKLETNVTPPDEDGIQNPSLSSAEDSTLKQEDDYKNDESEPDFDMDMDQTNESDNDSDYEPMPIKIELIRGKRRKRKKNTSLGSKKIENRHLEVDFSSAGNGKRKNPKSWTCSICKEMMDPSKRLEHSKTHKVKTYICEICGKSVGSQFSLQSHRRSHVPGAKPYKCSFCEQSFNYPGALKIHERQHTGEKPYQCSFCDKRFNQKVLKIHHEIMHNKPEVKPYKCDVCEKTFLRRPELKQHQKVHAVREDLPYKCSYCPSQFKSKDRWRPHEQAHRGEFRYVCGYCPKKFMRKHAKENHELVHTLNGARPHECELCKKAYGRVDNLRRHIKKHHPDMKKVEYKCIKCNKDFNSTEELQDHNKQHFIEDKQYVCPKCPDTRFVNELGLTTHLNRVHPEDGNYDCKYCGAKMNFDKLWKLYKHYGKNHYSDISNWNIS